MLTLFFSCSLWKSMLSFMPLASEFALSGAIRDHSMVGAPTSPPAILFNASNITAKHAPAIVKSLGATSL